MKKIAAVIFTLLLIVCGVYLTLRLGEAGTQKPDNAGFAEQNNNSVVQSITADTPTIEVTKHPRDETVRAGDITWFISHADNDDYIDWVFVNPNNAEYDRMDIQEEFPGFTVTLLTEDTVELNNIPMALNGWQIKAQFTNDDCTVYSKGATIHVVDYDVHYQQVIDLYRAFFAGDNSLRENVCEFAWDSSDLGYFVRDLDGDGTQELLIGAMDAVNAPCGGAVYDVYTLITNKKDEIEVLRTFSSTPRLRYYMTQNGRIYSIGSSGAGMTDCIVYEYYGNELHPIESVWTNITEEDPLGYYITYDGDRYASDTEKITEDYFYSIVSQYEENIEFLYPSGRIN